MKACQLSASQPSSSTAFGLFWLLLTLLAVRPAFAAPQLQLTVTTSVSSVAVGVVFDYTLQYKCASITENCLAATVTDVLPVELSGAASDVTLFSSAHTTAVAYTAATRTAKWTFVNPLPAGSTGQLKLSVKFPVGVTANGAQAVNTATMAATGAVSASSPPVTVAATASNKWTVAKTRVSGGTGAALDQDVVYQLQVCSNSSTLNLNNAVLTDVLPAGAVFVSASGNGVYANGNVSYALGNISSTASCGLYNLTLRYPTGVFALGGSVTNTAAVTGTVPGVGGDVAITPLTTSLTHTLSAGAAARTFTKKASASTATVGQSLTYYFDTANTGNVGLSNFSIEDAIPPQLNVTAIRSGTTSNNVAPTVAVEYQSSANGNWTPVPGFPRAVTSSTYSVAVSSMNLGTGVYITRLRYTYSNLPTAYKPSGSTADPSFVATVLASDRSGAPVVPGNIIVNTGMYSYSYNGVAGSGSSVANVTVVAPVVVDPITLPVPKVDKSVVGAASVLPNDTVTYEIALNNGSSAGAALANPVLGDLLDAGLDYVANSWSVYARPTGMPTPLFEAVPNYNGSGRTLLRWRLEGTAAYALPANATAKIRFQAKVKPGTPAGVIGNFAYLLNPALSSVNSGSCYTPLPVDSNDLDGDGDKAETLCGSKNAAANITVNATAAMESVLWVKGQIDGAYSKYPSNGLTVAGGSLLYKLQVSNVGNIAMKNAQVIDILPFTNDTGVLDPQNRLSAWRPNLIAPVVAPAGVVVYYSTEGNPCRTEFGYSPTGCAAPNWSITPPDDITRVQALKFDFGNIVLNPLDKLELTWPMRAPIGAPTHGEIAWNSFGYAAIRADNSAALLPSEPIKVGIAVQAPQPPAYGNHVWLDSNGNGLQDATEPGINGVRVDLHRDDGSVVDSTLTTNDAAGNPGFYQFTNLTPGTFYAMFYPPVGYAVIPRNAGSNRALDSDVDPASNTTAPVTLNWDQIDYNWDMGLKVATTASVGNYVWYDRNANGIQDEASNDGLNGVIVKAFASSNTSTPVASTVTADDQNGNPGFYRFDTLPPGSYVLEFSKPTGASFTSRSATGSSNQTASKADPATGRTASFSVVAGQYDINWDAGLIMPTGTASLGDRVWFDANNNGVYEPFGGEQGIDGVRVNLYRDSNNDGAFTAGVDQYYTTTTTYTAGGNPGYYSFGQLPAGRFIVQIDAVNFLRGKPLAGLLASTTVADPANGVDNDNNGSLLAGYGAVSRAVTLASAAQQDLDFGFTATYSLGNRVFLDDGAGDGTANDGVLNGGESGIAGVSVKLFAANAAGQATGSALSTQATDSSGHYRFDGLYYGQYVVVVDKAATAALGNLVNSSGVAADFTVANDGRDHGMDQPLGNGSVLRGGIASAAVTLGAGQEPLGETLGTSEAGQNGPDGDANNNLTADFGFTQGYSLGDRVWFDANQDGIQQASERGLAGVSVNLYAEDGATLLQTTASDGSGFYRFNNVGAGRYVVGFQAPPGYGYAPQNQGSGNLQDSFDSDVDGSGKTPVFALTGDNISVDAGLFLSNGQPAARIGDFIWYDSNRDGQQSTGESGLSCITVNLWDAGRANVLAAMVSDGRGFYEFVGLPAG
ncbi:MAG: SdrD B-like domain-containing protein, partial [Candidatus Methylumidiphilus sp.]